MLRVGLTGGIASGKSSVAEHFARLGATVIDTDQIARDVVEPGEPALAALVGALGSGILGPDGWLDRAALRRRLFADAALRRRVEGILHPAILGEMERRARAAGGPYQLLVIPLLAETGRPAIVDRVLVVDCPESVQIERLMRRDGTDEAEARQALAAQAGRAERLSLADDTVDNGGPPGALAAQVAALDGRYRALAGKT